MREEAQAALLGALEAGVERLLRLDPEAPSRLAPLAGRVIAVELVGARDAGGEEAILRLYLLPHPGGMQVLGRYAGEVHTVLRGTPLGLARLALPGDDTRGLFAGEVSIAGDVETGQRLKRLLAGLELDWEEQLSRVLGDAAAHRAGHTVRALRGWGERTRDALAHTVSEYLQHERRALPTREEVSQWLAAVDTLRDDAERLEARVRRLDAGRAAGTGPAAR